MNDVKFREVAAFVWSYWRRVPLLLSGALGCILAATLCDVFLPLAAGALVDSLTNVSGDAVPTQARMEMLFDALTALAMLVGLAAAFHLLREASYRFWIPLATVTMRRIVCDAFRRVQRFSADWHANNFAGATVRKISRGMWAYDVYADTVYHGFLPAMAVLVGVTANLFLHWPLMGSYVLAAVTVYVVVSVTMALRYIAPANVVMNEADSAMGAALADAVTCNPAVKSFGAEGREDSRFFGVADLWRARARRAWTREINGSAVQSLLTILLMAGLLSLALWYWSRGLATAGEVAFVMTSYFVVNGYLREVGMHVRNLQQAVNEIEDLVRFRRQDLGVSDRRGAVAFQPKRGRIDIQRVTFTYGNQEKPIYSDFSLGIAAGERVALVGPSGSGKSTFVKLLQRLYDLDGGRILIDGQDIASVTQESLRRAVALVPQDPALFHRSLAENIAYARPEAARAEIVAAAKRARAHDFIMALPDGYETLVGERGVKLSGGERQRVAIARALAARPALIVFDEPVSALDQSVRGHILELIADLQKSDGLSYLFIAHDLAVVRLIAHRVAIMEAGRIVETGATPQLIADPQSRAGRALVAAAPRLVR